MIKEILPPSLAKDENIKALTEALDKQLTKIEEQILNVLILPRIDHINDPEILDLLAWQFHIEGYDLAQSLEEKRNLIKRAIQLHRYKGTPYAIKEVLKALNLEGQVKEWFEYGGEPYHFKVELGITNREITPELRDKLIKLIEEYKNARSHLEEIILYYLSKGEVYFGLGCVGELEGEAPFFDTVEQTSKGQIFLAMGCVGELEGFAPMSTEGLPYG